MHGAGHSGLSFAPLAKENNDYRIISFDFRGHGANELKPSNDLSMETMIKDTEKVLQKIDELYPEDTIIIIGHSFGGAVAIKACCEILKSEFNMSLFEKIQGILVVDVVEGSALEALPFMMNVVSNRQKSFSSIEEAIKYMHKTQIRNLESSCVSIPPLLKEIKGILGKKTYEWKTDLVSSMQYWKGKRTNNNCICRLVHQYVKSLFITEDPERIDII